MRSLTRRRPCRLRPHLVLAGLVTLAAATVAQNAQAQGTPRSMAECERLKNDLAYNQCLAMFGPPARNVASSSYAGGNDAGPSTATVASTATIPGIPSVEDPDVEPTARKSRRGRASRRHGRSSASFDVGSAESGSGDSDSGSSRSRRRRR